MALMPVADALDAVLAGVTALPEVIISLDDAFHRTLARDVVALRTQPSHPLSAMDGYAVRAIDVAKVPARLTVIGEVAAGRPFGGAVGAGEAARIFTGGVIPDGADTVVIQEDTAREAGVVIVREAPRAGGHIRKAGIDFQQGQVLLSRGKRLSDRDLALAAAMNHATLTVHRAPRVALLASGDELVEPGTQPGPGQIVHSNAYALRAMLHGEGADIIELGLVRDDLEETRAAIRRGFDAGADVLITSGGASVGDHDLVQAALKAEGVEIAFWKIAMRPGKPMMSGRRGAMRVLGLPGNPISSYVCALLFAVPLVRALAGRADVQWQTRDAILGSDVAANDARQDFLRATLRHRAEGPPIATPLSHQDSSLTAALASAHALIIRPPHAPAARADSPCVILELPR